VRVFRSLEAVPADFGPCALTIGNFDGVHLGHRRILRRVVEIARERGWKSAALTFDPHPTRVVAPERTPPLLSLPERRAGWMAEEGVEQVLILPFTAELAARSPREFAVDLVAGRLGARAVLVGEDFRFGRAQAGDVTALTELGSEAGFETEIVGAVTCRGRTVSSSAIRELLPAGRVSLAARVLGREYALEGEVVGGFGIGSKETVPTLNLSTAAEIVPAAGVYATRTRDLDDGREWNSITNVGYRPTFGGEALTIETYLLSPFDGRTPARIGVAFLRRMREERKFASAAELKERILKDVRAAQAYFRRVAAWTRRPFTAQ
jgi:riboflavin kinase / FMN adenylyltransferase